MLCCSGWNDVAVIIVDNDGDAVVIREGSNQTPAHEYSDFRFRTYAPVAFRYFRELFGIQPDDFLVSWVDSVVIVVVIVVDSAPRLGVYYFLSSTVSVCMYRVGQKK